MPAVVVIRGSYRAGPFLLPLFCQLHHLVPVDCGPQDGSDRKPVRLIDFGFANQELKVPCRVVAAEYRVESAAAGRMSQSDAVGIAEQHQPGQIIKPAIKKWLIKPQSGKVAEQGRAIVRLKLGRELILTMQDCALIIVKLSTQLTPAGRLIVHAAEKVHRAILRCIDVAGPEQ